MNPIRNDILGDSATRDPAAGDTQTLTTAAPPPVPGYELGELIGRGGMGVRAVPERDSGTPAWASNRELQKIARVPNPAEPDEEPRSPRQSRPQFWRQAPAPAETAAARPPGPEGPLLSALRLGDELMLLLPLARVPDEADREAVQAAAAPLLKLLRTRRLVARTEGGD